jgi:hypothetical protein
MRSPSPCGRCLGVLNDIYRRRRCRWRHCREHRYLWLPTEPERLSYHRAALRVSRGREGMIAPQSPSLQVFVLIERVSRADVALEHLSSIATIQANDIIVLHGSPHRYSRCANFLCMNGLSEATQRVTNCGDQVRKLLRSERVVPNVAADDHSRGMRVGLFGIHDHPFALSCLTWLTTM